VIEAIEGAARTGKIGDGKVFVAALEQVMRIRTGETGGSLVHSETSFPGLRHEKTHRFSPWPAGLAQTALPGAAAPEAASDAAASAAAGGGRSRGRCGAGAQDRLRRHRLDADLHAAGHPHDHPRSGPVLRRPGAQQEHAERCWCRCS
jgi:hypothetical protein